MDHIFRRITAEEVPEMFALILRRMEWLRERGIRQWLFSEYDVFYPQSYYEQAQRNGEAFALEDKAAGRLICAAVIMESDERWNDDEPALYIHNFASDPERSGAGDAFLKCAEAYAAEKGKKYLRLDSAENNEALAAYYSVRGFVPVGSCEAGGYKGILRQKKLTP